MDSGVFLAFVIINFHTSQFGTFFLEKQNQFTVEKHHCCLSAMMLGNLD